MIEAMEESWFGLYKCGEVVIVSSIGELPFAYFIQWVLLFFKFRNGKGYGGGSLMESIYELYDFLDGLLDFGGFSKGRKMSSRTDTEFFSRGSRRMG
jgi:hypothetical protein